MFYYRLLFSLFLCGVLNDLCAQAEVYVSLDPSDPIAFTGDRIVYGGDTVMLGPRAFFIDGRFTGEEVADRPYVFRSVNDAAEVVNDGTETDPMVLYLAPYVYWIDDPDDPEIRVPPPGGNTPYGLEIKCEWLRFQGLNKDPRNVVLASNRGQTIGAKGNFTMFRFDGEGTAAENVTFGNYCNVDLEYPLLPALRRKKRAEAIVQAQLIHCNGDKIVARNVRFVSRLNLCPFVGGKRTLFDRCHFESTDDALSGTAVYLNSTFVFFSSKPWYHTRGTGAVLLNCDITSYTGGEQYFTKANGQLTVVDTRFTSPSMRSVNWRDTPPAATKNYQYDVRWNGKPFTIGAQNPENTVHLDGERLLDAYRIETGNSILYNTYNLLRGDDNWDPDHLEPRIRRLESRRGEDLTSLPVQLNITAERTELETGADSTELAVTFLRFGNYPAERQTVSWSVPDSVVNLVRVIPGDDGQSCRVFPRNETDHPASVVVTATASSGLEAAVELLVKPETLPAPAFASAPRLSVTDSGVVTVANELDASSYRDASSVSWYRCPTQACEEAIPVAVSRMDGPLRSYPLSSGDVGYYLLSEVAPRHERSASGNPRYAMLPAPITEGQIRGATPDVVTDFRHVAVENQPLVMPGFWRFAPLRVPDMKAPVEPGDAWTYGAGTGGSAGQTGLIQTGRTAALSYTPVGDTHGNMRVSLSLSPHKTAGQGFSVAPLYMDILVKYDPTEQNGVGLRIMRGTRYGNAVECYLVRYEEAEVIPLTEPVAISSFRSPFTLNMEVRGTELRVRGSTTADYGSEDYPGDVHDRLDLRAAIEPTRAGGFGVLYNGGSTTMINRVALRYD
ncbi:hypothetical protein [Lewinella sp. IMCC34191]|uniref:hypothetical protein n=1 Tax=Lewinella sp. IMCC34191 TaxID=2259172 RepID=UPI000E25C847|nr:hypothetical protein [Lewinella sp. IMCC34191]